MIANRLTLNQSKTEFMLIGSRQRIATFRSVPCLEIDGVPIDKVLQAKSLGVYLDENLSWNIQINELTKKIASGIGALKGVRSFVPVATLQLIFNSLVQPYFNYCCTVWDNCNKTLAEKLQKLSGIVYPTEKVTMISFLKVMTEKVTMFLSPSVFQENNRKSMKFYMTEYINLNIKIPFPFTTLSPHLHVTTMQMSMSELIFTLKSSQSLILLEFLVWLQLLHSVSV